MDQTIQMDTKMFQSSIKPYLNQIPINDVLEDYESKKVNRILKDITVFGDRHKVRFVPSNGHECFNHGIALKMFKT